jgi:CRP-like cAMP-binding protein
MVYGVLLPWGAGRGKEVACMPQPFHFRMGSLIYFQGDAADKVFILQNGKVSLVYQNMETGEDVRDQVQPGEFFGVKSALGRYPREENAIALADSTILAFTVPEFESLAMANTRIIMKMLTVFSNQMRRMHKQISSLMAQQEAKPDEGLFTVGEYYLKNKRYAQAKYVFSRYLTYYPSGNNSVMAAKNLEIAESALAGKSPGPGLGQSPAAKKPPRPAPSAEQPDAAKAYYDAVSLISQEKYHEAQAIFQKIVETSADAEWTARSAYETGRCLFFLNQFEACLKHYIGMLTQYPKHPDLRDAMFYIGQCHERCGRKEQAAAFYRKIIAMPSAEANDGTGVRAKRALDALEG